MSESPSTLSTHVSPEVPEGFQEIGWFGVRLVVPVEWNVSHFGGDGGKGFLVLSDLRGVAMRVRWRRVRDGAREVDQMRGRLGRKGMAFEGVEGFAEAFTVRVSEGEYLVVARGGGRVYEMQLRSLDGFVVRSFLRGMNGGTKHEDTKSTKKHEGEMWRWVVYGIEAEVAVSAKLKGVRLLPGAARLSFVNGKGCEVYGVFSLAEELLKGSSLRQVGERFLGLGQLRGVWVGEATEFPEFVGFGRRRWVPWVKVIFGFVLWHDRERNQVGWRLTGSRGFLKIWRS